MAKQLSNDNEVRKNKGNLKDNKKPMTINWIPIELHHWAEERKQEGKTM
jgi:hypothetical protein